MTGIQPILPRPVRQSAFTLIELLAGMAVLSILVLMLGRFFSESSRAWDTGTGQAEISSSGRVIMDFVVADLSTAVADNRLQFALDSDDDDGDTYWTSALRKNDMITFDSLGEMPEGTPTGKRSAARITYYLRESKDVKGSGTGQFRLMRNRVKDPSKIYAHPIPTNPLSDGSADVVAENVVSFNIWAYDDAGNRVDHYQSVSQGNITPLWVDVYLELLTSKDAKRAALFPAKTAAQQAYVLEHAKGFLARVHFPNREGYSK